MEATPKRPIRGNGQALPSVVRARVRQNLTQKALGNLLDVRQGTVARWENGIREPTRTQARKLAHVLGIPLATIESEISTAFPE